VHWRSDANDDLEMIEPVVWQCRFAPPLPEETIQGDCSWLVATVGNNSVCVTDCNEGKVVFKYTHLDEANEVLQCVAWTIVPFEKTLVRLLAVAGMFLMMARI
jgi:hypothetical protein